MPGEEHRYSKNHVAQRHINAMLEVCAKGTRGREPEEVGMEAGS